ncbi:hypothetical protein [Sphingomonas sp.]|uniref:hypothetical protein n=1 Tax=Sphingomonas sp. TaxID=28214 RepID=UPI0025CC7275|nr:hypothetical protein [Sphingomonas sp.]
MIGLAMLLVATAPQQEPAMMYGFPSAQSCGDWIAERRGSGQALQAWVLGFMTGFNFYGPAGSGANDDMSAQSIISYVDGYCDKNRLDSVLQATVALVKDVRKRRGR